ncbi:MAG: hypothetical protein WC222_09420 [Parachlamydiales bacterium]|jgi:hypothetical protein
MGMFVHTIVDRIDNILQHDSSVPGADIYYNVKARTASAVLGIVGTAGSIVVRLPKALENCVTFLVKRDISYLGYAVGNLTTAATLDILSGVLSTLNNVLAPETQPLSKIIEGVSVIKYKYSEENYVRVTSPWQARIISPFRGLSLAIKALVKGILNLSSAIFSKDIQSTASRGIKGIFWLTPKLLITGLVGTVFTSVGKQNGILISNEEKFCIQNGNERETYNIDETVHRSNSLYSYREGSYAIFMGFKLRCPKTS